MAGKRKTAAQILRELEASRPVYAQSGSAEAGYAQALRDALGRLNGRAPFAYDVGSDPAYAQYARQYARQGRRAMADAAANAAALTGGYGSSYAATAGNQAYLQQMSALTDMIPQLYEAAYGRYESEGDALADEAARYESLMGTELSRHKAELSAWQKERDYYAKKAAEEALAAARSARSGRRGGGSRATIQDVKTLSGAGAAGGAGAGGIGAPVSASRVRTRAGQGGRTAL